MSSEWRSLKRPIGTQSVTLKRPGTGRVKLTREALGRIQEYVQDESWKPEAGGVLLGRHISGTSDIVVDSVTVPSEADRRKRFRFFRARKGHQKQVSEIWASSGGRVVYLGEWHTHPVPVPVPSWIDLLDWRRKMFVDRFGRHLFFLIVGTCEIRMWEGRRRGFRLRPLREE